MKKVLILGGTRFIGRVLVEQLQQRPNLELVLYNRQSSNPELFPKLRVIKGDREQDDFDALAKENWDSIIDLSAYFQLSLERLLRRVQGRVGRYIFLSTISVYDFAQLKKKAVGETFPVAACTKEQMRDTEMKTYGIRKAECERVLLRMEKMSKIILRPSLVYGRYDYTDRFYYWLHKIKTQEKIALPDGGKELGTLTYVDDLARLLAEAMNVEADVFPVYNATTNTPRPFAETFRTMCAAVGRHPQAETIEGKELLAKGIRPGLDLPLWHTIDVAIDNSKLRRDFKTELLPFENSVKETVAYYEKLGWPEPVLGRR